MRRGAGGRADDVAKQQRTRQRQHPLHDQVGFYLLPPEPKYGVEGGAGGKGKSKGGKIQLDAIAEVSDESRQSTPNLSLSTNQEDQLRPDSFTFVSPKLLRENTALPGLVMFERPTRHPSLDDIRGYGRRIRQRHPQPVQPTDRALIYGTAGAGSGDSAAYAADLKLPPLAATGVPGGGVLSRQQREAAVDHSKCLHPQSRICENLKYNLHQLKIRSQTELFQSLLDAIVFGPAEVEPIDAEEVLGVRSVDYLRSKFRRNVLPSSGETPPAAKGPGVIQQQQIPIPPPPPPPPPPQPKQLFQRQVRPRQYVVAHNQRLQQGQGGGGPKLNSDGREDSNDGDEDDDNGVDNRGDYDYYRYGGFTRNKSTFQFDARTLPPRKYSFLMSRPGLRLQFNRFARYGEPRASGDFITFEQTQKWFKQAGIIDHWNVTTADAHAFFKKISKGSKWLDFDGWRIFLEELSWRKRLNIAYLIDKLEFTGAAKPGGSNLLQTAVGTAADKDTR